LTKAPGEIIIIAIVLEPISKLDQSLQPVKAAGDFFLGAEVLIIIDMAGSPSWEICNPRYR
jgi:hypothetical protein